MFSIAENFREATAPKRYKCYRYRQLWPKNCMLEVG